MRDSFCETDFSIYSGPAVDCYLHSEGAIAQAVHRNAILLHSSVLGMSPSEQTMIFLHELAHLQQLAQPGDDPVRALEEEAWEAAHAWSAGRRYRVKGMARGPLNAVAIIQGGDAGHPFAPPWYNSNPVEPIGNGSTIVVKESIVIKDITLEAVMDAIIAKKQTEVVVVSHGWSEGLAMPLVAGKTLIGGAQKQQIYPLSADGSSSAGTGSGGLKAPIKSVKDVADQAKISEQQVIALREKMNKIRAMNLKHVAFRSCDMGQDPDGAMDAFRLFFGAASVSAPKLYDMYGQFTPSVGAGVEAWAKKMRPAGFHIAIDGGVAFGTKKTDAPNAYKIVSKAEDKDKLAAWVKKHIADRLGSDGVIVYHGMLDLGIASPEAPNVYFVRDDSFISNIVYYAGGT